MLFSIVPPEDVWSEPPAVAQAAVYRWIRLSGGGLVQLSPGPDGYRVARLVSPEPRDYLDPALQPGARWWAEDHLQG